VPPTRFQVLDTVSKLGFEVQEKKQNTGRSVEYKVHMGAKNDQKVLLGLAYYSNNLL